jgi:hypothetical protein
MTVLSYLEFSLCSAFFHPVSGSFRIFFFFLSLAIKTGQSESKRKKSSIKNKKFLKYSAQAVDDYHLGKRSYACSRDREELIKLDANAVFTFYFSFALWDFMRNSQCPENPSEVK